MLYISVEENIVKINFSLAYHDYLLYLHHENGGVAQMVRAQDS